MPAPKTPKARKRVITQICGVPTSTSGTLYALCDDSTVWWYDNGGNWRQVDTSGIEDTRDQNPRTPAA